MSYDYTKLTVAPIQAPLTTTHTNVLSKEERPLQKLTANKDRMYKVLTQGGSEMPLRNDKVNKLIEDKVAHILIDKDGKTRMISKEDIKEKL